MSWYVKVGSGRDEWAFPDPGHSRVTEAMRAIRFGSMAEREPTREDALLLASCVEAYAYLLRDAPSTKAAVDKLTQMRRALRGTPPAANETRRADRGK